jgi:hypothetical protein
VERKRRSTGGDSQPKRGGKDAEARLYSGGKVARVLAKLGVDFRAFVAEYDQDTSRPSRAVPLSDAERAAVERFLKHQQIAQLADELGCSIASAHSRITKFVLETRVPE